MSGMVGIFHRDGAPVDRDVLQRMVAPIQHRGPDGITYWINGPVGMGFLKLCTTSEAEQETQPLYEAKSGLCLTFDGRVDNREYLSGLLSSQGFTVETDTDAEIVLRAFECWGPTCAEKILGDFALTVWDANQRALFCARDILGFRPFYFYHDHRIFAWASELCSLLELPVCDRILNEGMIGEYLAANIVSKSETLFQDISRLPPAHHLLVGTSTSSSKRYWSLDPSKQLLYSSGEEYTEHFLCLFKDAVACRLRSNGRVGTQLSGGLDSSSVTVMAYGLRPESLDLEAFSLVFPGTTCDESTYIQAVIENYDLNSSQFRPIPRSIDWFQAQVRRYFDIPDYPNGSMGDPIREAARSNGCRVLLTGLGGDEWFRSTHYHYVDLLRKLRFRELSRWMQSDLGVYHTPTTSIKKLIKKLILLSSPREIVEPIQHLRGNKRVPPWIDSAFASKIHLESRLYNPIDWKQFSSYSQGFLFTASTDNWTSTHPIEMEERAAAWFGLEQRHPLDDRRLIEFGLAIPENQRRCGSQEKYIIRNAMKGYLPEQVRTRVTKAEFTPVFIEAFNAIGNSEFFKSSSVLAQMGWLDDTEICSMYGEMESQGRHIWPLWITFGIGLWVDSVFGNQAT